MDSVVDRVVAALRRFLRSLGFELSFSEAELRQMLVRAGRFLEESPSPSAATGGQVAEAAFSRTDIDPDQKVPVTALRRGVFGDAERDTKAARRRAQDFIEGIRKEQRSFVNADTGWTIGLSRAGNKEMLSWTAEPIEIEALAALPRLARVAVLAKTEQHTPTGKDDSIRAWHTFYAPLRRGNETRIARLVVREDVNGNRAYDLQASGLLKDESPAEASRTPNPESGASTPMAGLTEVTVAQLRAAVNGVDRPGWQWSQSPDTSGSSREGQSLFSRAEQVGTTAFRRWFGASKVTDGDGTPRVVYHGTASEFWRFDKARLAGSTGHMSAPQGFFFAQDKVKARRYAEKAADGVPADERVIDVFLSIQNPKIMTTAELLEIDSQDDARDLRAQLQRQGFDGIHLAEIGQWVAFEPSQAKSASQNSGAFDPENDDMRFSKPDPGVVADVLAALGELDSAFRYPKVAATSLSGAVAEIDPAVEYLGEDTRPDEREETGADARHVFKTVAGRMVYVYTRGGNRGGDVWIDVSRLDPGQGGDAIYQAVADYAANVGRTFIGDPAGLSVDAVVRRTYHMLASAIRHGGIAHFSPAREQLAGLPEEGIPALQWAGNHAERVTALTSTFVSAMQARFPKIKDYGYDFDRRTFVDARGNALSSAELLERVTGSRAGTLGLNRRSAATSVFLDALARAEGGLRPRLLAQALQRPAQLVDFDSVGPLFSRPDPAATIEAIDSVLGGTPESVGARLKRAFRGLKPENLKENTRPTWLGALTLRHLAELGEDVRLRHVAAYARRVQRMATDRNVMQEEASTTADAWEAFQRKDRSGADATANLMHDTTVAGVDPSRDYVNLRTGTTKRGEDEAVTAESIERRKDLVRKDLAQARSSEAVKRLEAELDGLDGLLARERRRREQYPEFVRRFVALPEAGRKLYVEARDAYERQSDRLLEALVNRIEALEIDGREQAKMVAQIRQQFESDRLAGPYFPLQRFGDFWISAEDAEGESAFFMYERAEDWREAQRDLAARGFRIKSAGRKLDEARAVAGASGGFMAQLQGVLELGGVDPKTRDEVYQLYLRTLPELSMRKHSIHRKGTVGYSGDALRSFSANMFHGSYQIARLRHVHELESTMLRMKEAVQEISRDDPERAAKGAALYSELNKRHEWVMNPRDSKAVSGLTSLGFAWYLGTTPAAALVNLTQTAIVTFPVLAARFGPAKAFNALSNGMARAMRNADGNLTRGLSDEERAAFKVWYESGAIDRSQAHNLAGLSETDTRAYSPIVRRGMQVISFLFHKAEVVNREATALAAFRLAREAGQSFNAAVAYAGDVVTESHFDYSNANRARFMQSNAAKVLLLFRQYSLNMTWFLWRNLYQSLKAESPRVRKEAQKKLAGVLGMTAVFSGVMGMPLMSVMFGVANAAAAAFGGGDDDDDPFDAEVAFRNFLADMLGPDAARVLARGPVDAATGVNISSRVSLNDLWFREPNRELEGRAMADYLLEQAAGPLFGGMLVNTLRGLQLVGEGHTWRGVETMSPKAVKDGMKALRYSTQGVNTLRGDPIIEDLSVGEALLQLAGFSPASLNERYDGISAAKDFEQRIMDRHASLLNAYAMAWRAQDADTMRKVAEKIRAFNQAQPEVGISMGTIRRSLESRMRYSSRAEGGVVLNPKLAERAREQARFAE